MCGLCVKVQALCNKNAGFDSGWSFLGDLVIKISSVCLMNYSWPQPGNYDTFFWCNDVKEQKTIDWTDNEWFS